MLSEVTTNIVDSGNGTVGGNGTGLTAKIGVSSVESIAPIVIKSSMDVNTIREKLGNSPLADACLDAVENGASTIYCLPLNASTQGTIGKAEHTGTGTATVTASGNPNNEFTIIVQVESGGMTNEATVILSEDGGASWIDEQTIPLTGTIIVPNTGVTLTFGSEAGKTFVAGDTYTFKATPPAASNQDILSAIGLLKNYPAKIEMIHVVGTTTAALWASIENVLTTWEQEDGRPVFAMCEQRKPTDEETAATYVDAIKSDAKGIRGRHVVVVSQWAKYVRSDGRTQEINMAGCISGWIARSKESTSIAYTNEFVFAESKITKLLPEGIQDYMETLDSSRYVFLRTYNGLDGYYVAAANTTAAETSTYSDIETIRVMYRLVRDVYQRALYHQNEDFDQSKPDVAYARLQADLNVPIDAAKEDKIISDGVVVLLADEINDDKDKKIPVRISYVPRGYYRTIDLNFYVVNNLE